MSVTVRPIAGDDPRYGVQDRDPKILFSEGWRYLDIPWVSSLHWDVLMGVAGPTEFMVLASTENLTKNIRRGQVLLSPSAIQSWSDYYNQIVLKKQ